MYRPLNRYSTPVEIATRLQSLAREQTEKALNIVIEIMTSSEVAPDIRLKAAEMLWNRGWGKPRETLALENAAMTPRRRLVREIVHVTETRDEFENKDKDKDKDLTVDYDEIKNGNGDGTPH